MDRVGRVFTSQAAEDQTRVGSEGFDQLRRSGVKLQRASMVSCPMKPKRELVYKAQRRTEMIES